MRDYYEILNVSKNSSKGEIKKAYRKIAMIYHPDRNPNDKKAEEMFKEYLKVQYEGAELFYEYSILKEKRGNMDEAKKFILKAYEMYKEADDELELKGKIFARYNDLIEQFN